MRRGGSRSPLAWLGGLLLVYLGGPVVAFVVRLAFSHQRGFHDAGLFPALWTSVVAATISTAIITVLGVPLAYVLARSHSRTAGVIGLLVQLPLAVPPVMAGILLIYVVGPYTTTGRAFGGALTGTLAGIVLAQTFVAAPFLVVSARAALGSVDPSLGDVAATLGHGELRRFWNVAVPAAAPGIRAGMVLAWLRAFGEYGATVILAYHPTSLPVYTFTQFSATGLPGTMAPTALSLGVAVGAVGVFRLVLRRRRGPGSGSRLGPGSGSGLGLGLGRLGRPGPTGPAPALAADAAGGAGLSAVPAGVGPSVVAAGGPVRFALDHRLGTFRLQVRYEGTATRLAVLGPSGSGKSTLLRCLAGLYGSAPGYVGYGHRDVTALAPERRHVGYVAQSFGLFAHLRVWDQLMFGRGSTAVLARRWLERLGLDGLEERLPTQLSGGQRQRVALAQALCRSPGVLLLDEPFSGLDTPVRRELQQELRDLQRQTGIATVLVTHDPQEAALLADDVLVVVDGQPVQIGPVRDVYRRPVSLEAARLLGVPNVARATVAVPGELAVAGARLAADTGPLAPGTVVLWSVAPHRVRVGPVSPVGAAFDQQAVPAGAVLGSVADVVDLGIETRVVVRLGDGLTLEVHDGGDAPLQPGTRCRVVIDPSAVHMWESEPPDVEPAGAPVASA